MAPENRPTANEGLILTHSVLIGVTPLIPVPFLDDAVKAYLQRRLVRSLARARGVELGGDDVKQLADERGGCLSGCLGTVLLYPIKKLVRKLLIFLEMKRAVDLVSLSYHRGLLFDYALERGWVGAPGTRPAADVRSAVDEVIRETPVRPVEEAVRSTFRQSKSALVGAASLMQRALRGVSGRPTVDEVGVAIERVEEEEERQVEGVVASLAARIQAIPGEHFDAMRRRLAARLEGPPRGA